MNPKNLLGLPVIINEKNGMPAIELRRLTQDKELMRGIILAAVNEQPIIIMPQFTNRLKSLGSLIDKGLAKYNPNGDIELII